jgi:hypothetical protein
MFGVYDIVKSDRVDGEVGINSDCPLERQILGDISGLESVGSKGERP